MIFGGPNLMKNHVFFRTSFFFMKNHDFVETMLFLKEIDGFGGSGSILEVIGTGQNLKK